MFWAGGNETSDKWCMYILYLIGSIVHVLIRITLVQVLSNSFKQLNTQAIRNNENAGDN